MRSRVLWLVAVGGLAWGTGCVMPATVRQNEEISRRVRKDMIDFYENMAQAYYLLGYEYYKLYKEALDAKDEDAAKQYFNNARLYKQYYEDLKGSVNVMRASFGLPSKEEPTSGTAATLTAPPPADTSTSRTEGVSPEPAAPIVPAGERPAVEAVTSPTTTSAEPKPSFWRRLPLVRKQSEAK